MEMSSLVNEFEEDTSVIRIGKAAVCESAGKFVLKNVPVLEPSAGQVLVALEGCGVCSSSIPVFEGRPWFSYPLGPGAPGHEGWGKVEAVGDGVVDFKPGDRVAILSQNAFAEFDTVTQDAVVKIPPELGGVPFPGEPLGCAMNIMERANISSGQSVAILGIGFLGAILTSLALKEGAQVLALSRRPYSLSVAKYLGAHHTLLMEDNRQVVDMVKEIIPQGCDRVIEATGYQWPLSVASEIIRVRGRLIIAGYHQDGLRSVNMQQWNWQGIDVINAHERDTSRYMRGIRAAIQAVKSGFLHPFSLYTHHYDLDNLTLAFETMSSRPEGFIKALVMI